jgi:ATP phosphoribosyltransferase
MTPEEKLKMEELERIVAELKAWVEARKEQQIAYPLDQASKDIINEFNLPT